MNIYRLFVEKKSRYNHFSERFSSEIRNLLGINIQDARTLIRYDVQGISDNEFQKAVTQIFSEPPVDDVVFEKLDIDNSYTVFAIEFLPGQYDQRADSASQCLQLLTQKERPLVRCATVYALKGITDAECKKIKKYLINAVESREANLAKPTDLHLQVEQPAMVEQLAGFIDMNEEQAKAMHKGLGLAMTISDLLWVQKYFKSENRNPYITEIKVIDTYWSDHCRHTTFLTELTDVKISNSNPHIKQAHNLYQDLFNKYNAGREDKYHCMMDIATIGAKHLKKEGKVNDLDESDEINACSIKAKVDIDGQNKDYLIMFKNETHNHPTEIEPYGGAATCLGGAIRDPLSGRTYVYQSMRVSGAGNPTEPLNNTIEGKLPQHTLCTVSAAGFSSYGNQIGLTTGLVREFYHPNYRAKRLEAGFVIGAAPAENVYRAKPVTNDVVVLLGGETGRDGCGGATGSSKSHDLTSIEECSAEVQKGNALTERKIQRLFRNGEATRLIKKCNDFGAGGVCVAIGELTDSLMIELNAVPKKYAGLNATEIAISESQERMAVVLSPNDVEKFRKFAEEENLTATVVAKVTDSGRLQMRYNDVLVVDVARTFLDTNGVKQTTTAEIIEDANTYFAPTVHKFEYTPLEEELTSRLSDLNITSQKGLGERFDATIGAATVVMPFGGKYQLTPATAMVAKVPVLEGNTDTCSVCAYGFNPDMMSSSPFIGAVNSVLTSVSKVVATGVERNKVRLTFQEYFKRLGNDPKRWGEPLGALLGALEAQVKLETPAIGGKDSMSGSFINMDVPPTLVSFAVGMSKASKVIHNTFAKAGLYVYSLPHQRDKYGMPNLEYSAALLDKVYSLISEGKAINSSIVEEGGDTIAVVKSCLGNKLGFEFTSTCFDNSFGNIILAFETEQDFGSVEAIYLGKTTDNGFFALGNDKVSVDKCVEAFTSKLESVYPTTASNDNTNIIEATTNHTIKKTVNLNLAKPRVFIPVFMGTNCEYDTARKFREAGADVDVFVVKNQSSKDIDESVKHIAKYIKNSNIVAFAGGFSGGDEPDGSGKFIATTFRNTLISDEISQLLDQRDGLMIGICNGFQAMIKLGLMTGRISELNAESPTLFYNKLPRHISSISQIRVTNNHSPWLNMVEKGEVFNVAISHGEGRLVCPDATLQQLAQSGQIATQYVDLHNQPTTVSPFNPNASYNAIEGLTSPDGRIFGKMGHSERIGDNLYKNVPANYDMRIFESGVKYFK